VRAWRQPRFYAWGYFCLTLAGSPDHSVGGSLPIDPAQVLVYYYFGPRSEMTLLLGALLLLGGTLTDTFTWIVFFAVVLSICRIP
jgi:hypothetical protein